MSVRSALFAHVSAALMAGWRMHFGTQSHAGKTRAASEVHDARVGFCRPFSPALAMIKPGLKSRYEAAASFEGAQTAPKKGRGGDTIRRSYVAGGIEQSFAQGVSDEFGDGMHVELPHDVGAVIVHRFDRDAEFSRDLGIALTS